MRMRPRRLSDRWADWVSMSRCRPVLLLVCALALFVAPACAPSGTTSSPPPGRAERQAELAARIAEVDPLNPRHYQRRAGQTYTAGVTAHVQRRGTIPYDNMTLPLVSPDGQYVATHRGLAPTWATLLAEPGAAVPAATRIEIYRLPDNEEDAPQVQAIVEEAGLLGRACTDDGFLIESPQDNGSRWIGLASWETGQVSWLIADDRAVSAFATMGADGRLAWSSRPVDGGHFDLMIRRGAEEWRLPGQGGDWLMPTWSGAGDGLFALLLRDETLDVTHMIASSAADVRRTIRPLPLAAAKATIDTAYQTLNATVATMTGRPAARDQLVFFHPVRLCAAVWEPPSVPVLLDRDSVAAVIDRDDPAYVLMTTGKDLIRRRLLDEERMDRITLIAGTQVPRPTAAEEWPYILLEPSEGVIGVTALRLLPVKEIAEQ
jgi:hypothetical protein